MAVKKAKAKDNVVNVTAKDGEERESIGAEMIGPHMRHAHLANLMIAPLLASSNPDLIPREADYFVLAKKRAKESSEQRKAALSELLAAQAITLDGVFTEMARRMQLNAGQHLHATELYARIAMKAQTGSRSAIEAWAKLNQPREQTVRHVHVNEGGQAVIADQFHHHTGGQQNGQSIRQPLTPAAGAAGAGPALPRPDSIGQALPVPGDQRREAVPDARRQGKRRA